MPLFGGILQWQLTSRRAQRKRDGYAAVTADDGTNTMGGDDDGDGGNENVIHVRRSGNTSGMSGGRASSFITRTIMNRAASDATVEQPTPEMYRPYEDDDEENTRASQSSFTSSSSSQIVSRAMVTAPRDGSSSMVSLSAAGAAGGFADEGQEMTTISIASQPSPSSNNNGHNNGSVMIGVGARRTASQWEELKVK